MKHFDDFNPIAVAVWFLCAAGIAMFSMNPIILTASLIGTVLFLLIKNKNKNRSLYLLTLMFFLAMTALNPLFNHNGGTVLFIMNDLPVTLEALIYGAFASLMIVSVIYHFRNFSDIMTEDKLLYIFGGLSPGLSLVLSMALRYIPLMTRQIKKTENSQRALGLYKDDNIIDKIRGRLSIFGIIVTWSLENGIITADSMTARGYGTGKRSRYSLFRWRKWDILLVILTAVLFSLTVFGLQGTSSEYYPYFKLPELTAKNLTAYISYGILLLIPIFIEIKEAIKWKCLKSEI